MISESSSRSTFSPAAGGWWVVVCRCKDRWLVAFQRPEQASVPNSTAQAQGKPDGPEIPISIRSARAPQAEEALAPLLRCAVRSGGVTGRSVAVRRRLEREVGVARFATGRDVTGATPAGYLTSRNLNSTRPIVACGALDGPRAPSRAGQIQILRSRRTLAALKFLVLQPAVVLVLARGGRASPFPTDRRGASWRMISVSETGAVIDLST